MSPLRFVRKLPRLRQVQGHRLFDHDMLACGQRAIRVLDRKGAPVALRVRRSSGDPRVAIAYPEPGARLEPSEDYFIEVALGSSTPDAASNSRGVMRK